MDPDIKEIVQRLMHLMYGHNYEVCLGVDTFDGATHEDFKKSIKTRYPDTHPEKYPLIPCSLDEFFSEIRDMFDYRGDVVSGLELPDEKEVELKYWQDNYFEYIKQNITPNVKCYYYPDPEGIPGYPVFWGFQVVLFPGNGKIVFAYGSASD